MMKRLKDRLFQNFILVTLLLMFTQGPLLRQCIGLALDWDQGIAWCLQWISWQLQWISWHLQRISWYLQCISWQIQWISWQILRMRKNLLRLLRLVESLGLGLGFWILNPALQNRCFKSQQEVSTIQIYLGLVRLS